MSDVLYHAEHYFGWMRANPTWQRESETIDTLIAEIERLRHELADAHGVAQACEIRAERAEAEIERLRAAVRYAAQSIDAGVPTLEIRGALLEALDA